MEQFHDYDAAAAAYDDDDDTAMTCFAQASEIIIK